MWIIGRRNLVRHITIVNSFCYGQQTRLNDIYDKKINYCRSQRNFIERSRRNLQNTKSKNLPIWETSFKRMIPLKIWKNFPEFPNATKDSHGRVLVAQLLVTTIHLKRTQSNYARLMQLMWIRHDTVPEFIRKIRRYVMHSLDYIKAGNVATEKQLSAIYIVWVLKWMALDLFTTRVVQDRCSSTTAIYEQQNFAREYVVL